MLVGLKCYIYWDTFLLFNGVEAIFNSEVEDIAAIVKLAVLPIHV
jgi:hypothetical protein